MDLLDFLNGQAQYLYSLQTMNSNSTQSTSEKLKHSEMALEALANVIKHNRGNNFFKEYRNRYFLCNTVLFQGVEIQCIGHFKLLFCLLRLESYKKLQEMTLNVLVNVTGSKECIDDISASQVFHFLLQSIYSLPEQRPVSLAVLNSLVGDTRLVKECLAQGKIVIVGFILGEWFHGFVLKE